MSESIENMIYCARGYRVMLDSDLAALYGVETKNLNKALKRNTDRFPEDFAFQLTEEEWNALRSQIATLDSKTDNSLRFQIGTLNKNSAGRGRHTKYLPHVFTEPCVVMLANILRPPRRIKMSIEVVRAFIRLRQVLASQTKLTKEVAELKSFILKHAQKSDQEFNKLWNAIEKLSTSPSNKNQRQIGFDLS